MDPEAGLPVSLPDELPIVERSAVRLVVLDARDRVLLFHTRDPDHPELGMWWELPGGGIDPGETYLDAAVRELGEETGIAANRAQVGPPTWRRRASFRHRQTRHVQDEVIVPLRLLVAGPDVDESRRLDYEREDYIDFRWWPIPEILSSGARFYPGRPSIRSSVAGSRSGSGDCARKLGNCKANCGGLGISIARELAERNGATLRLAESKKGAAFVLELPRVRAIALDIGAAMPSLG